MGLYRLLGFITALVVVTSCTSTRLASSAHHYRCRGFMHTLSARLSNGYRNRHAFLSTIPRRHHRVVVSVNADKPTSRRVGRGGNKEKAATSTPIPPLIPVLDAGRYPLHNRTKQWVVFSDLHCSTQSLSVCKEVLHRVHQEALQRQAGIIFLGDWWHLRGALRVEVLNDVLTELQEWTTPVVMIPGNHDQVTLDGMVHGLTPLQYALRGESQAVIISEPTLFLDALWLPYSRNGTQIRTALEHMSLVTTKPPSAIFCHADVRGACMNDNAWSRRGLLPSFFPPDIPTFSGHFHKPHRVSQFSITYIGSPYQTTLAEAGQAKRFLLLSRGQGTRASGKWSEVDSIPIDIGRRYFRVSSVEGARNLVASTQLRAGDRVVLLTESEPLGVVVEKLRTDLAKVGDDGGGVDLEVREARADVVPTLSMGLDDELASPLLDYESMGPAEVFRAYLQEQEQLLQDGERNSISTSRRVAWGNLGLAMIGEGGSGANVTSARRKGRAGSSGAPVRLELDSVRMQGYGPFREAVEYPLSQRGLVLIRGRNMDDPGAESNAAGKSKLAMAALWALTGQVDERPVMDGKVTEVAFDVRAPGSSSSSSSSSSSGGAKKGKKSKAKDQGSEDDEAPIRVERAAFAEVVLRGRANGMAFEVERRRGSKTNQLTFNLGGKDLTRQGVKETQWAIEESLGVGPDFLGVAIFCGQHQLNGLLEATDVKLKERLAQVVNMEVWQDLTEKAKATAKAREEAVSTLDSQLALRELDVATRLSEQATIRTALQEAEAEYDRQKVTGPVPDLVSLEGDLLKLSMKMEEARVAWQTEMASASKAGEAERRMAEWAGRQVTLSDRAMRTEEKVINAADMLGMKKLVGEDLRREVEKARAAIVVQMKVAADAHRRCQDEVAVLEARLLSIEESVDIVDHHTEHHRQREGGGGGGGEAACPTCGREWEEEGWEARREALRLEADGIRMKVTQLKAESSEKGGHFSAMRIRSEELDLLQALLEQLKAERAELQKAYTIGAQEKEEEARRGGEGNWQARIAAKEQQYVEAKAAYDELQASYPVAMQSLAQLQGFENKVASLRERAEEKEKDLSALKASLTTLRHERGEAKEEAQTFQELVEHLGVRGVQAFVYRGAVTQLERLVNHFLSVLADGTLRIQLSLEKERITKAVSVRGSSGVAFPRSLSQLSGGQWRRVSLAFLFAFRELSRLRSRVDCNVMVLDEVLNHLDGPGRLRVGRVLKAMLQRNISRSAIAKDGGNDDDYVGDATTGGLDTIIVILQDLAAYELQDSFDRIDEVVKDRDESIVVVDRAEEPSLGQEVDVRKESFL